MTWSPAVTVAAVIARADRYLMVEEQVDGVLVVNQPAGHLEFGETLVEAVRREVREETGLPFLVGGLVGIYQWTVPGTRRAYLRFCFSGDVDDSDDAGPLDPDIVATHWLTRAQIVGGERPPRSPLVVRCIDDAAVRAPLSPALLDAVS
jgi:phosphatase NudJ